MMRAEYVEVSSEGTVGEVEGTVVGEGEETVGEGEESGKRNLCCISREGPEVVWQGIWRSWHGVSVRIMIRKG